MKQIFLLLAFGLAVCGCSSLLVPTTTQKEVSIPAQTNMVIVTNQTVVTNTLLPVVVTNTVVTPAKVEIVTVTNWIPNPAIVSGIQTVQSANAAFNPTPSAPIVNWATYGATALLGVYAAWKNKKSNALQTTLDTVIKGVETAPPGIGLDSVKKSIAKVAAITGISSQVDSHVQRVSSTLQDVLEDGKITAEELVRLANDATVSIESIPSQYRSSVSKLRA